MTAPGRTALTGSFERFARVALPAYGLPRDTELRLLNISENGTFLVEHATGRAVLRVHRPDYNSPCMIYSELAWMDAVREQTPVSTPAVIPAVDGRRVVEAGAGGHRRQCVLFEWLPGIEPPDDELSHRLATIGEHTAHLHDHARRWNRPEWFVRFSWDIEDTLGHAPRWGHWLDTPGVRGDIAVVLRRAAERVRARLARYGRGHDRYGLIHADLRQANLLLDGDRTHVIDFDDCGFGWHVYDFAAAVSFLEHDSRLRKWFETWLSGYRRVRELPIADRAEVPTFVMLRRLMLVAWIGSHATTELARSKGADYVRVSADLADRYLSGTLL